MGYVFIDKKFITDKIKEYKKLKSINLLSGSVYNTIINELEEILNESKPLVQKKISKNTKNLIDTIRK